MSDHTIIQPEEEEEEEEEEIPSLPQDQSPLLATQQPHQQKDDDGDTNLDKTLQKLDYFLTLLGFNQSSVLRFGLSWIAFLLIGVALPVVVLELSNCPGCDKFQIKRFELDIIASQACLAAVSLFCVSFNLRKYGLRKFLFVDRFSGQMERFSDYYIQKFSDSIHLLILWILPCFLLKIAREIIRISHVHHESWLQSFAILLAFIVAWTYVTTIFLTACIMFHLVCYLQIIHFDDYGKKILEGDSEVLLFIEEHTRLRHHLSKISHRFRIYLLLEFLVVTASQFVTLFQTTGYSGIITFINCGDFAVSSIVQVVGITLCLNAAAKISHRAQGIASIASRWHALAACSSTGSSQVGVSNSVGNMEVANPLHSVILNYSESDLESLDYIAGHTNTPLASSISSYHKRQAFVLYLQNNPGGITIFGWTVDRSLINTIFFIQLSLVLFVLGKTIVFTSKRGYLLLSRNVHSTERAAAIHLFGQSIC